MALFKIDLKIGKHIANKGTVDDMHTYVESMLIYIVETTL